MEEKDYPVYMKQFIGFVRRGTVTQIQLNDFNRWMNGEKCTPELKEDAVSWASQAEAVIAKTPSHAHTFNTVRPHSQEGGRGGYNQGGRSGYNRGGRSGYNQGGRKQSGRNNRQPETNNTNAAPASIVGSPFHNPYTFIPFPNQKPERHEPTPLSIDETEEGKLDRLSGIIQVEIKTLSPLLTSQAEKGRKQYHQILKIGKDVIVPASSVRGSLRNLMSVICGGTLSYVDADLWLCQGRDTQLGGIKTSLYLARVEKTGNSFHNATVTWGEASLVRDAELKELLHTDDLPARFGLNKKAGNQKKDILALWIDHPNHPTKYRIEKASWRPDDSNDCPWLVKISGKKVSSPSCKGSEEDVCRLLFEQNHIDEPNRNALAKLKKRTTYWIDHQWEPTIIQSRESAKCCWKVEINPFSKDAIKFFGPPHEGAFQPTKTMELSKELWADYQGRNRNSVMPELFKDDLIWLESKNEDSMISSEKDVKSIQWARWGRTGKKLIDKVVLRGFLPDSMNSDGKVDIVSDLFGTVFMTNNNQKQSDDKVSMAFAARIVPENLVFGDSADSVIRKNHMPPLSSPHPGCIAFYLDNTDPDSISLDDLPRGYKVYRNSTKTEEDHDAPWHYDTQPVYSKRFEEAGEIVFSADLLPAGKTGTLKMSFRALSHKELALLLLTLSCDLRFGGGKPLGLGHCVAERIKVVNEDGRILCEFKPKRAALPDGYSIDDTWIRRAELYCKTQEPVDKMLYPRFKKEKSGDCGGMIWFAKFATIKKKANKGLQTIWLDESLQKTIGYEQIQAQPLPQFKEDNPSGDLLYGYDVQFSGHSKGAHFFVSEINEPTETRIDPDAPHEGNHSPNRETRKAIRKQRE